MRLIREGKLLDALYKRVSLQIPCFEKVGTEFTWISYRYLEGKMVKDSFNQFSEIQKMEFADRLFDFIQDFKNAISKEKADEIGFQDAEHWDFLKIASISNKMILTKSQKVALQLCLNLGPKIPTMKKTLLHLDLNPENLLIDPKSKTLTAVLDFTDAAIAPLYMELKPVIQISSELARLLDCKFIESGEESQIIYAALAHLISRFDYLVDAIEEHNQKKQNEMLKSIYDFFNDFPEFSKIELPEQINYHESEKSFQ